MRKARSRLNQFEPQLDARFAPKFAPKFGPRVDLLAEWVAERDLVRRKTRKLVLCALAAVVATGIVCPIAQRFRLDALQAMAHENTDLLLMTQRLERAKLVSAADAGLKKPQIVDSLGAHSDLLTGRLYAILNCARPGMAFSHVHAEAKTGGIEIRCEADAENFAIASQFADAASGLDSGSGNLSATRPNLVFGENGVEFDYQQNVKLP